MAPKKTTASSSVETETVEVNIDDLMIGRTPQEKALLYRASNSVKATSHMDTKVNMGNYESLGFGFTVSVPLGLSEEEYEAYLAMCREAIQRGVNVLNDEVAVRRERIKAQLKGANYSG